MPLFIFGNSRLFYWLAAFILIGRILLWLHSLLWQFYRTDVCLLSITVCICWRWPYFYFVRWWIFLSVQSYSTALIWVCPQFFYFDIFYRAACIVFFATWLAIWFSVEFGYSSTLCVRGLATLPIVKKIIIKKNLNLNLKIIIKIIMIKYHNTNEK